MQIEGIRIRQFRQNWSHFKRGLVFLLKMEELKNFMI
ncbi:unnamed protein product [Paramecium primaurelia]|uniref:Uncharacterized protein n=1 Tax=Paramecium primaurelia TaxID=5886 RepID=A0A8S1QPT0_PARPR|nr:unnamed protein product [Paramecium primaurelia]